jgi:alpha-glucuronidase
MLRTFWVCGGLLAAGILQAETGYEAWLRYAALDQATVRQYREAVPAAVTVVGDSAVAANARQELTRGIRGMLGRTLRWEARVPGESAIVLGTLAEVRKAAPQLTLNGTIEPEGFWLKTLTVNGVRYLVITGADERGVLYGSFALLRKIGAREPVLTLDEKQAPSNSIRWLNLWDTLGGAMPAVASVAVRPSATRPVPTTVAGPVPPPSPPPGAGSVLFENGRVREDLSRLNDYARMLASIGINGCAISNVNADQRLLTPEYMPQLKRLAEVFRGWGIRMVLPVDFASPQRVGGLDTYDPRDARVQAFWKSKVDELYVGIPDLAGFVMKADSEGQTGPAAYRRTIADAANTLARALKPHSGLLLYRAFVYNNRIEYTDLKADRGRAAYDNFRPLDGQFDDNVVVQIKNGPIDFQVREPASPLFSGLEKTSQAIELQIFQEYNGQGRHLVFEVPWWKDNLDFDMRVGNNPTPVKAIVSGKVFGRPAGGFVGVTTTTMEDTWERSLFSQANLYGFGRLAWDPDLSSQRISDEWTRLTFGNDPRLVKTISDMQLRSWPVYEKYTGPLGLQTLTECCSSAPGTNAGYNHFGPAVEASENNGWGQWHRADAKGVGMDRTVATGTGFIGQFRPGVAKMYESLETCPDDLLLFMHHVPYTHKLHSGKTVIQYIYDSHYEGAEATLQYVRDWKSLEGLIDEQRYKQILAGLQYQTGAAQIWRDAVAGWFYKASGIPDAKARVGSYPGRVEAESMKLEGYKPKKVGWWETASGGTAVECAAAPCTASFRYEGAPGLYTLSVRYFDYPQGVSRFRLRVGSQLIEDWLADDRFPSRIPQPDGASSTRRVVSGVALRRGDEIRIEGLPEAPETAALDYVEVLAE